MMNDATLKQMAVVKAIVRRLYKTAHPYERTVSDQRFLPAYFNIVCFVWERGTSDIQQLFCLIYCKGLEALPNTKRAGHEAA
jgi:hypothetical protein